MDEGTDYEWLPYDKVWRYNRYVVNPNGDPVPYDFNGVVHLMLAALDNLRERALDVEIQEIGHSFSGEQKEFFLRVAKSLDNFVAEESGNE
ncbi:MAG TPA: hypothetical protein VIP46_06505 [Pyrinomonadaceae bacterium]